MWRSLAALLEGDDLSIGANGTFPFPTPMASFFPEVYWACDGTGMHLLGSASRWLWNGGDDTTNENMEDWVR